MFALPRFRERRFRGNDGRPYTGLTVANEAQFESSDGDRHVDGALRWSYSFDSWDLGLHYFNGTSRDPALIPTGNAELTTRYRQMEQFGIDALSIFGDLNTKLKIVQKDGHEIIRHTEAVSGIEYTFVGFLSPLQEKEILPLHWCDSESANPITSLLCNDRIDAGLVLEYLWDERGEEATQLFQNDFLAGLRFAFNDERSCDALLGVIRDFDHGSSTLSLEASTRLFESFRLSSELRIFSNTTDDPLLRSLEDEDFLRVDLAYFF